MASIRKRRTGEDENETSVDASTSQEPLSSAEQRRMERFVGYLDALETKRQEEEARAHASRGWMRRSLHGLGTVLQSPWFSLTQVVISLSLLLFVMLLIQDHEEALHRLQRDVARLSLHR